MDKALQTVLDSQTEFSSHIRQCARDVGKDNFLIVGEVVGEIPISYVPLMTIPRLPVALDMVRRMLIVTMPSALYFGRGKEPNQVLTNATAAMIATNESNPDE